MLKKGQYVKVVFRNSTQAEGFVDSWENNSATLISEDARSKMIIMNISSDVMAIKISLEKEMPKKISNDEGAADLVQKSKIEDLEDSFEDVKVSSGINENLRIQSLANLKKMLISEERKEIQEKLRSHYPSTATTIGTYYGNPFIKKPMSK